MAGHTPIVSFVARSGTGKTTFLERLIAELVSRGIRVMALKHDVHGFEVDRPGKDTWRLKQAGARRVLIANSERLALIGDVDGEQSLLSLVDRYADEVDLVLTEGYRRSGMPKILLARSGAPQPFDPAPEELDGALALLTDHEPGICVELPRLALDDPGPCADLLVERFLGAQTLRRRLTGVVLAGGRSSRMGRDKAFLELAGRPVLPELVEGLAEVCEGGVLVVRRDRSQELPALPAAARVVEDLLPDHAALGGLYTGLVLASTPFVFLGACDMPLMQPSLVRWLSQLPPASADVLLPLHDGRPQPLHAVYGHRCLAAMKEALLSGEFRMDGWHGSVRVERVGEERWSEVDPSGRSFVNVNSAEGLRRAEQLAIQPRVATLPPTHSASEEG